MVIQESDLGAIPFLETIRKIYVFGRNFGAVTNLSPVELQNLTLFYGKNGQGKSTIQDIVKAIHLVDDRYIIFNARRHGSQSSPKNMSEYFRRFDVKEFPKHGPTILGFHIEAYLEGRTSPSKTYTFGIGSQKDKKQFYFIEGADKQDLSPLVANSVTYADFLRGLKVIGDAGTYKSSKSIKEYHTLLHQKHLIFYNADEDYLEFMRRMRDCVEVIRGGRGIPSDRLKELLFPLKHSSEELEDVLRAINSTFEQFQRYRIDRAKHQQTLETLNALVACYTQYFEEYLIPKYAHEFFAIRQEIHTLAQKTESLKKERTELEENQDEKTTRCDEIADALGEITKELETLADILGDLNILQEELSLNSDLIFIDKADLKETQYRLEQAIGKYEGEIGSFNSSIAIRGGLIKRIKGEIEDQDRAVEDLDQMLGTYEKRQLRQKAEIRENIIKISSIRDLHKKIEGKRSLVQEKSTAIESLTLRNPQILQWKQSVLEKDIIEDFQMIQKNFNEIKQHGMKVLAELQDNLSTLDKADKEERPLPLEIKALDLKHLYNYFEGVNLKDAAELETFLTEYKFHLVVPPSKFDHLKTILDNLPAESISRLEKLDFLLPTDGSSIEQLVSDIRQKGDDVYMAFIKQFQTYSIRKLITPEYFGQETRRERLQELKERIIHQKRVIENEITPIIEYLQEIQEARSVFNEYTKNLEKILGGRNFSTFLAELEEKAENLEPMLKATETKILEIEQKIRDQERVKTEKVKKIEEHRQEIQEAKNRIKDRETEIEKLQGRIDDIQKSINQSDEFIPKIIDVKDAFVKRVKTFRLEICQNAIEHMKAPLSEWKSHYKADLRSIGEELRALEGESKKKERKFEHEKNKLDLEIETIKKKMGEIKEELKDVEGEKTSTSSRLSEKRAEMDRVLKEKLFGRIHLIEMEYDAWVTKKLAAIGAHPPELTEIEKKGRSFLREYNESINAVTELYPISEPIAYDDELRPDLKEIVNSFPVEISYGRKFNFQSFIDGQIKQLDVAIKGMVGNYATQIRAFWSTIQSEIKAKRRENADYQKYVDNVTFGTIERIEFKLVPNQFFDQLKSLLNELNELEKNKRIESFFGDPEQIQENFEDYFFTRIFGDKNYGRKRAFNCYTYFDFSIERGSGEFSRNIFESSGGEGGAAEFLVFVIAINTLREEMRHKGELFIYLDEAGMWDPTVLGNIIDLSTHFNVHTILCQVESPKTLQKSGFLTYLVRNGIAVPSKVIPTGFDTSTKIINKATGLDDL